MGSGTYSVAYLCYFNIFVPVFMRGMGHSWGGVELIRLAVTAVKLD